MSDDVFKALTATAEALETLKSAMDIVRREMENYRLQLAAQGAGDLTLGKARDDG